MAKDLWKQTQLIKKSKPIFRAELKLYLDNGTWNLHLMQTGDGFIEVYEQDAFHFPGPIVTEKDIPTAIRSFITISGDLLNKI